MGKLVKLLFLFLFLFLLIGEVAMQTPYAQNKVRKWIEKKSKNTLQIGKLEGFFPFWFRFSEVNYKQENLEASFSKINLFVSPTTLLFGKVSLIKAHIENGAIQTKPNPSSSAWPSLPFSLHIHSFEIDSLRYNFIEDLQITGMGEIKKDFSFLLNLKYKDTIAHFSLEGNENEKKVRLIGSIKQPPQAPPNNLSFGLSSSDSEEFAPQILGFSAEANGQRPFTRQKSTRDASKVPENEREKPKTQVNMNVWISGYYDWDTGSLKGEARGEVDDWKITGEIDFSPKKLTLTNAEIIKGRIYFTSCASLDLQTEEFTSTGVFRNHVYTAHGKLQWEDNVLSFPYFFVNYSENNVEGTLVYSLQSQSFEGEITVHLNDMTPLPTGQPMKGKGVAHFSFAPSQILFTFSGQEIQWKDLSLSQIDLNGTWQEENLKFQLSINDFIISDPSYEVFPTTHLKLSGEATQERVLFKGDIYGIGAMPFSISGEIPIHLNWQPFDLTVNKQAPFALDFKGNGSIDPLLAFLENASLIARGDIDVNLSIRGTWETPMLQGTLTYMNGWVESLVTGALFRDIHLLLEGEGQSLVIRSLIAHDPGRGDLSATGWIKLDIENSFPFDVTFIAHRFTLLASDPLTANVNAQLSVAGNLRQITLSGDAVIREGHLAIPNQIPPQIPVLEVIYLNPLPTPKPEIEEKKHPLPVTWDLHIEIPGNLTIQGRGLISEWRGELRMRGLQENLAYSGKLNLVQGRFTIIGRTFDLTEGKIIIHGLEPKDIYVNLKGDIELATITASLMINGNLDGIHVAFCSTPPMSTNQILSWILFNQDVNELTPFQACRLANALASLSGKYSGSKVFNNIKEGLGIDVFDITNCDFDSNDFTFQVGKYISQGTFVGVSKSISGDFDSVLIQTRLYRNFYLEANYGGSLNGLTPNGGKMIFKWYKSY